MIVMSGSGYVGLVSGACFADFGHDVVCMDKAAEKIEALEACRRSGVEHLVYASSSSVYSDRPLNGPGLRETDPAETQVSLYAANKRACGSSPSMAPGAGQTWPTTASPR